MSRTPIEDRWERRLQNWALWCVRGSARASHVSTVYAGTGDRFEALTTPQPLVGEALDTDDLVQRLSELHRRALRAQYIWTGTAAMVAAELNIHPNTLTNRVRAAKFNLDDLDQARRGRAMRKVKA